MLQEFSVESKNSTLYLVMRNAVQDGCEKHFVRKMNMKNLLWIIVVVVSAIGYWYWGNTQDEVIAYNDGVIELLAEDNRHYAGVVNHLEQYYAGETVDVEKMREALNTLDSTHRDVIIKTGQITVPDYETCNVFHTAFVNFLDNSTGIIAAYDVITNHIESHNPGSEVDLEEIDVTLNSLLAKDEELFTEITDAQILMAKKFKFDLE